MIDLFTYCILLTKKLCLNYLFLLQTYMHIYSTNECEHVNGFINVKLILLLILLPILLIINTLYLHYIYICTNIVLIVIRSTNEQCYFI